MCQAVGTSYGQICCRTFCDTYIDVLVLFNVPQQISLYSCYFNFRVLLDPQLEASARNSSIHCCAGKTWPNNTVCPTQKLFNFHTISVWKKKKRFPLYCSFCQQATCYSTMVWRKQYVNQLLYICRIISSRIQNFCSPMHTWNMARHNSV